MKIRGQLVRTVKERIASKSVHRESGCIEWVGSIRGKYGRMVIGSRTDNSRRFVGVHRAAYEANIGPIPSGLYVCHTCDNPVCVNPAHLWLGTAQQNTADMVSKGRLRSQYITSPPPPLQEQDK